MAKTPWGILPVALASGSLLALTFAPANAYADVSVAGDLDFVAPIDSIAGTGGGFAIRLGYQAELPLVVVTPELAFTFDSFSGSFAPKVYRGMAGFRLGVGEILRSGAFIHLGFGTIRPDEPDYSHTDLAYDVGVFLELAVLPSLSVGAHAAYNHVTGGPNALQWASTGGQVAFTF